MSFTLPFRLPIAECLLLTTVASLLVATAFLSVKDELMGDPIQFGELELVAVRGLGTVLRNKHGQHVAIWVQAESETKGQWVPMSRD
ncbi:MAG: hypothetical protein JWN70_3207 [Planctomycetaceae bacterium]|nr:hypothetical protein [Planctomycetaceae bacterium]